MTDLKDSISLAEKLKRESVTMSKSPTMLRRRMIHKVHPSLRTINGKEYEPFLVSIGPYHHGMQNLQEMEKYKVRMLQLLLDDRTEDTVENYIAAITEIEEEARSYYSSDIKMNPEKFVEMMILDGCFILEFVRKVQGIIRHNMSVFDTILLLPDIYRDLALYENQLPLFVLSKLFELTKGENENFADLIGELVRHFCFQYIGEKKEPKVDRAEIEQSPHLLDLVYMTCKNSIFMKQDQPDAIDLLDLEKYFEEDAKISEKEKGRDFHFIKSATTLEETGVVFKKAKKAGAKLCDITFTKGVLEIPQLMISDRTESLFRNLVAYEQYIREYDFTDYLVFMDYLINSPKDVELLRHRGIIVNMLGDDEYVSNMFNKICAFVVTKISTSKFVDLCTRINKYSEDRLHVWMAKLWRKYFDSPWTLISFLAAIVLLGLTIVQTVFSIISYTNPK